MKICSTIIVADLAKSTELAGAQNGAAWTASARTIIDRAAGGLIILDFQGIRLATVSWLREAILTLRRYADAVRTDLLFAATNLAPLVREEFEETLRATGNVFLLLPENGDPKPLLIGVLDPALRETLIAVDGKPEFDATVISRSIPAVGASAANNRLAALEKKGILTSQRRGRLRVYRPVLEGLVYGN